MVSSVDSWLDTAEGEIDVTSRPSRTVVAHLQGRAALEHPPRFVSARQPDEQPFEGHSFAEPEHIFSSSRYALVEPSVERHAERADSYS